MAPSKDHLYTFTMNVIDVIEYAKKLIINELMKSDMMFKENFIHQRIEELFFRQYYDIKQRMQRLSNYTLLIRDLDERAMMNMILSNEAPPELVYLTKTYESDVHGKKQEDIANSSKSTYNSKYADGSLETIVTTKKNVRHMDEKEQTRLENGIRHEVVYMHMPDNEMDIKYAKFFKELIHEFFNANIDCEKKWRYPWPSIKVTLKRNVLYLSRRGSDKLFAVATTN